MYMTLSTDRYIVLKGVRVLGYLFWTTSDNWEWADGYGPKFGLVAVDRANNLARKPRPSYYLFSKVYPFSVEKRPLFPVLVHSFFSGLLFCVLSRVLTT